MPDEVPDDQEVGRKTHLRDHCELGLHPLDRLGRGRVAVTLAKALEGNLAEEVTWIGPIRGREVGNEYLSEWDLDLGPLGNLEGGGHRIRPLREGLGHLVCVLQVVLVGVEAHLRLVEGRLRLDAEQGTVVVEVLPGQVVDVGRRDEGAPDFTGNPGDLLVCEILVLDPVLLDLQVDLVRTEDLDQGIEVFAGLVGPAFDDPAHETRLEAAGQGHHALRITLEQLQVRVGLSLVEAFEEGVGAEGDQVPESDVADREERQVVSLVPTRFRECRPVVDEVGLDPEDRLHPLVETGRIHVHGAIHDAMVGKAQGRHFEFGCPGCHLPDVAGPVQHRVLAVDV